MAVVGPLAVPAKEAGVRLSSISRSDVRKGDRFGDVSGNRQMGFGRKSGWFRAEMASNGYVGGGGWSKRDSGGFESPRVYKRLDSCLIVPPAKGREVRGVVQFLGGAFIGAVPEVTYRYMFELLAKEGFLIVSVPYNVTFDHLQAAKEVYEKFNACLDVLLVNGLHDYGVTAEEIAQLPLFSVGHSNGALLQVLVGSLFSEKLPKANAIIAYNNRPAAEAVPYFEQVGPLVSQMMPLVEASPLYSMARSASGRVLAHTHTTFTYLRLMISDGHGHDAWKVILETTGQLISNVDEEAMVSLTKFTDQLPKVLSQVTEGVSEFRPTPSENCDCFSRSYKIPHTLLVKFDVDAIDETDLLERTLKPRVESIGGTLEKVTLSGNHITPCIQEPKWQVGAVYTPADAIAQGLKTLSLSDIRTLSRTISDWFRRYEN